MEFLIIDDNNLDLVLEVEGYSHEQVSDVYNCIRQQFQEAVECVFTRILHQELPATIVIQMEQSSIDELKGKGFVRYASYNALCSSADEIYFTVYEDTIRKILKNGSEVDFLDTAIHETIHAADHPTIAQNVGFLNDIRTNILYRLKTKEERILNAGLFFVLGMMDL